MKIISTIPGTQFAQDFLANNKISFGYSRDNLYNVASYLPDIVLTHDTEAANEVALEYPSIKFLCPNGEFPLYSYEMKYGFNLDEIFSPKKYIVKSDIFYVNRTGEKSKLFIQKLRSLNVDVKVCGNPYGAIGVGDFHDSLIIDFYKGCAYGAAEDIHDVLRILALGKPCITPYNFPFTYNGLDVNFSLNDCVPINGQINFALGQTYYDIYAEIMQIAGYSEIAEYFINKKQGILNEN